MCAVMSRQVDSPRCLSGETLESSVFARRTIPVVNELAGLASPEFLARHGRERKLKPDQIVLAQGATGPGIIAVQEGVLASYRTHAGGRAEVFDFHYPGDLVFALQTDGGAPVTVKALVPARVYCFSLESLLENLAEEPGLALDAMKMLCGRLMAQQSDLFLVARSSFEQRLATFFRDLGRRIGREDEDGLWVPLPMRRCDIASYLGLRSETLSRITARWRGSGLLLETGRHLLHFPDVGQLEAQGLDQNQGPSGAPGE